MIINLSLVVEDILLKWDALSQGNKFHAMLATNSIAEAIDYYRLLKAAKPELKVSALFDPNIDNVQSLFAQYQSSDDFLSLS